MTEFPCDGPVTVSAGLASGSIDVVAEPRSTAAVTVEPFDGTDAGRQAAEETTVELRGDTLHVRAPDGSGWRRNPPPLRFEIRVPTDSTLDVTVASAEVDCRGRYTDAKLRAASGDCFVEHVTGDVSAKTASGDIRLGTVEGGANVGSASGDVTAVRIGGDARIRAASGAISIGQADASVRAQTASGEVRVAVATRGALSLTSVSGEVSVGVAAGTGVWLDLHTLSGSTRSDLKFEGGTPQKGHDLTVQVRTVSGDIEVHRVVTAAA